MRFLLSVFLSLLFCENGTSQSFLWAKQLGGTSSWDQANGVAVDGSGNVYTIGSFRNTGDFDPGPGAFPLTAMYYSDIFVSKLDASGNFVWAKRIGGMGDDDGLSITADAVGNIYFCGDIEASVDMDPDTGVAALNGAWGKTPFVCKWDSAGNYIWAKQFGGTNGGGYAASITLDQQGNVITTGDFQGLNDFDPGSGTFNMGSSGYDDIFVSKLDNAGNFVWARRMGGSSYDNGRAVAIDPSGNVLVTGDFRGMGDFDPGTPVYVLTAPVSYPNSFAAKLDPNGNFLWAGQFSGSNWGEGHGIAADAQGNVLITGQFKDTVDFDPGSGNYFAVPPQLPSTGAFVTKLDASGNFVWVKLLGGSVYTTAASLKIGNSGDIYTTGLFGGNEDFDPGSGVFTLYSFSNSMFISKLDSAGNFRGAYAAGIISQCSVHSTSIAVDVQDNVYTTGYFTGAPDFDPGNGFFGMNAANGCIFVHKMASAVGISEPDQDESLLVYPNPGNGRFSIRSGVLLQGLRVYDAAGQVVVERNGPVSSMDISVLAPGIYLLRVNTEKGISTRKLIVE